MKSIVIFLILGYGVFMAIPIIIGSYLQKKGIIVRYAKSNIFYGLISFLYYTALSVVFAYLFLKINKC